MEVLLFRLSLSLFNSLFRSLVQYKYFVDGDWRHDERQPHVTGSYGVVNTLLLTQSADHLPAISNPESPGNRMNMDVDSENFQRVVGLHSCFRDHAYVNVLHSYI